MVHLDLHLMQKVKSIFISLQKRKTIEINAKIG